MALAPPQSQEPRKARGPFFICGPFHGPDPVRVPAGTVVIAATAQDRGGRSDTEGLSGPSAARAVIIPALAREARDTVQIPAGPVLFAAAGVIPAGTESGGAVVPPDVNVVGSVVTMELLSQLADCGPEWWPLVGLVVGTLRVDSGALRYRGPAACYPPVIPATGLMAGPDKVDAWFALHGYIPGPAGFAERIGQGQPGFRVYVRASDDRTIAPCAIAYLADRRASRGERGEPVPRRVLEAQTLATSMAAAAPDFSGVPVPTFFILPYIPKFASDWEEAAKIRRVFPALLSYFDLAAGEHQMFPRFVPIPPHDDNVPVIHPGPALYSVISAPDAGRAAFFAAGGSHRFFLCLRETYHNEPAVQCPGDPVQLGPL